MYSENAPLSNLNISEDVPVRNDDDNKRQHHADDDEEDGVVVGGGAVPQTLLSLAVELLRRPADVVRQVDGETCHPGRHDGDDSATASEHGIVHAVPADVDVTIDGDDGDGEQRCDTADDTEAGRNRTQQSSTAKQPLLSYHCTFNTTLAYTIFLLIGRPL